MRGCFVTGTDTGVGKTVVAAAIAAALRADRIRVAVIKPVITGLDEPAPVGWPHDHELLARATGCTPQDVAPFSYGPPVSPHLAAASSGRRLDPAAVRAAVARAGRGADALVVEGVGGLLVPLSDGDDVRALARDLSLPLVIAARPGLGTINHTLLTLECARRAGLSVAAVVLTPWLQDPGLIERSNLETIARLGEVHVATLATVGEPTVAQLAQAGRTLPLQRLIG